MGQKTNYIINPFQINVDPMERLLLVNFEKDPDKSYVGFEPQVFNDNIHGEGHLIIGWRLDGKVDVYHQPGLKLDPRDYDIAGKGLANMVEREFTEAYYEINDLGVQAYYKFIDIDNRAVVIKITERNSKKRKPFGLLAPMGDAAENPSALPLILLHDFYFVRKKYTEFEISINGKLHKPDELPLMMDGTKMSFIRYSPQPLIVTLNPASDGELETLEVNFQQRNVSLDEHDFELEWVNDQPAIKSIRRRNKTHPITLFFQEAFPDVMTLVNNTTIKGNFEIEGHPTTGRVSGHYIIEKKDDKIKIIMIPSQGWEPKPTKLSLRFLCSVAKIFKNWPKTYQWTAYIEERKDAGYHMQSQWKRII